jgi:hypothetical protein
MAQRDLFLDGAPGADLTRPTPDPPTDPEGRVADLELWFQYEAEYQDPDWRDGMTRALDLWSQIDDRWSQDQVDRVRDLIMYIFSDSFRKATNCFWDWRMRNPGVKLA